MASTWPQWVEKPEQVAELVDWVRWKTQDRAKIVIAIGTHTVAVAKGRQLDPENAIAMLEDLQDVIAQTIRQMQAPGQNVTHLSQRIPER